MDHSRQSSGLFQTLSASILVRIALLFLVDVALIVLSQTVSLILLYQFDLAALRASVYYAWVSTTLPLYVGLTLLIFALLGLYSSLWRFIGVEEALRIILATVLVSLAQYVGMHLLRRHLPETFCVLNATFLTVFVCAERFSYRLLRAVRARFTNRSLARTMLVGAGAAATLALIDLNSSDWSHNRVVCLIDDDPRKQGRRLRGIPIVGTTDDIPAMVRRHRIEQIILAMPSATASQRRRISAICQKTGCETKILPSIAQIASGRLDIRQIRKVQIEDLLGRDSVKVDLDEIAAYVDGKTVLVTGGGGSIGSELCRQIASHAPKLLLIFDIYENSAYDIQQELRKKYPDLPMQVLIGSVRDKGRLEAVFAAYRPEIVYHAAAHKHVPLMEVSPHEAVKNNVFGTRNLCEVASAYGVDTFVQISTDKAVNPTNVMGATKRICEMLVQSYGRTSRTKFVCVRFGNVLGSNGSVIPLFRRQIAQGGPVTVTHKDIIRYFMTIPEAVSLVLQSGAYAKNGEIYVLDMGDPVRIDDLARNMIRLSGFEPDVDIPIEYVGLRPGEKLFEELLMNEEGMQSTANHLIHIGKPLVFDPERFFVQLETLEVACHQPDSDIRACIREIVPTYHPENAPAVPV